MRCFVVLVASLIASVATRAEAQEGPQCVFNGKSYRLGHRLSPADCTTCVCKGDPPAFRCSHSCDGCRAFSALENGEVEYSTIDLTPGTIASFYCEAEHELFGPATALCLPGLQWNETLPECLPFRQCPQPKNPTRGLVYNRQPVYRPGDKALFKCKKGSTNTGSAFQVCQENLKWSRDGPDCRKKRKGGCGDPGEIENGAKTGSSYAVGDVVRYSCHEGYFIRGAPSITCLRNGGLWSHPPPTCEITLENIDTLAQRFGDAIGQYDPDSSAMGDSAIDLVFVLDKSGSVSNTDFKLSLEFVKETVKAFTDVSANVRFAIITYSRHAEIETHYGRPSQVNQVCRNIRRRTYGPTATRRALDEVRDNFLLDNRHCYNCTAPTERPPDKDFFTYPCPSCYDTCPSNDCPDCGSTLLFLVTDGKSNWAGDPRHAAKCLKASGIEIFSVGVTSNINIAELRDIASEPLSSHLYLIRNFEDALQLVFLAKKQFK